MPYIPKSKPSPFRVRRRVRHTATNREGRIVCRWGGISGCLECANLLEGGDIIVINPNSKSPRRISRCCKATVISASCSNIVDVMLDDGTLISTHEMYIHSIK